MGALDQLQHAVRIFTDLGWCGITPGADICTLPMGTTQQRETVVAALSNTRWPSLLQDPTYTDTFETPPHTYIPALQLFAVRAGVAAKYFTRWPEVPHRAAVLAVVKERGISYINSFIKHTNPELTIDELPFATHYAPESVLLVHAGTPVPNLPTYINNWALSAIPILAPRYNKRFHTTPDPAITEDLILSRYLEHITTGLQHPKLAFGPFWKILLAGMNRGMIDRQTAVDYAIRALDTAHRRRHKNQCVEMLFDDLTVTDSELINHIDSLVPYIATGEYAYVTSFGTRLIAAAPRTTLPDIAQAAATVTSIGGQTAVLSALIDRGEYLPQLRPRLAELTQSRDTTVAHRASRLIGETPQPQPEIIPNIWQPKPRKWRVPKITLGKATPETVTHALQRITIDDFATDINREKFLALFVKLAAKNLDEAHRAVQNATEGLIAKWATNKLERWSRIHRTEPLPIAREHAILTNIGTIPCLLSQPTREDLSIDFRDLNKRLKQYEKKNALVIEPDLILALCRLDPTTIPPDTTVECSSQILLDTKVKLGRNAGQVVTEYLTDSYKEPELVPDQWEYLHPLPIKQPLSLDGMPNRIGGGNHLPIGVFPHWTTDAAHTGITGGRRITGARMGIRAQQAVRTNTPLSPGLAMNLLGLLRTSPRGDHIEGAYEAVLSAWHNGLLRPGKTNAKLLYWHTQVTHFRGLAEPLEKLAKDGLLSVVWPVLDDLLGIAARREGATLGALEVAQTMANLAPSVVAAVTTKHAPVTALDVPNLREIASREGNSKVLKAASTAVALLPEPVRKLRTPNKPKEITLAEFETLWTPEINNRPACPDNLNLHIQQGSIVQLTTASTTYQVEDFDLFTKHPAFFIWQVSTTTENTNTTTTDTTQPENTAWLAWRNGQIEILEKPHYKRPEQQTYAPDTILACVLINLSTTAGYDNGYRYISRLLNNNQITAASITNAMRTICPYLEHWNPTITMRLLRNEPHHIATLWPILAELVQHAATLPRLPKWINPVLDIITTQQTALLLAMGHNYIQPQRFSALIDIAHAPMKQPSAAHQKATAIAAAFGLVEPKTHQ
ncbi:MAG: hypothetical protein Q4D85_07060 [Corynebacterium sp.]|uniref:hypothetical protein n=1 Tax=Corynebacterium sp. TaxID=1720 RepID=UPI0026DD478C|nr:hypothetical protein [Corynebacterium sp.]MDO5098505.1 hypothetical protein [Corynebacterium sp.]